MGKSPLAINPDPSPRINLVEIMQAIDAENRDVGGGEGRKSAENTPPPPLQLEHSASGVDASVSRASVGSVRSQGSMKRRFVDFSSAKKKEEKERVARVTKKRGQVASDTNGLIPKSLLAEGCSYPCQQCTV